MKKKKYMKKKILISFVALFLVNYSSWGQSYPPSLTGYNIDILVGNSASISVAGDEDGFSTWTSTNHGLLGTNAVLTVSEPDQYRKFGKGSSGVTPFNVKTNPRDPNLSATGGYWVGDVFHVEQGTPVTFMVNSADGNYWTSSGGGANIFFRGSVGGTVIGSGQNSYSVNEIGTQTYVWTFVDGATNQTNITHTIVWDVPSITTYIITTSSNPDTGGSTSGGGTFNAGTSQTVTATAYTGYHFVNWTEGGNEVSTDNPYSFNLDRDRNLVANFELIPIVNAQTPTISAQPQGAAVDVGTPVTLSVSASVTDGGTLSYQWYADDSAISGATGSSYSPPTATAGTTSYYVVITNTNNSVNGAATATATSDAATVVVNGSGTAIETIDASKLIVYSQNGKLVIKSDSEPIARVEIFNLSGQLLKAVQSGGGTSVEISGLPMKQALIVKVIMNNGNPVIIRKRLLF